MLAGDIVNFKTFIIEFLKCKFSINYDLIANKKLLKIRTFSYKRSIKNITKSFKYAID